MVGRWGPKTAGGLGRRDGGGDREGRVPGASFRPLRSQRPWLEARSSCGLLGADQGPGYVCSRPQGPAAWDPEACVYLMGTMGMRP